MSDTVTLIASNGTQFAAPLDAARKSATIANLLDDVDDIDDGIPLHVSEEDLRVVVEWCTGGEPAIGSLEMAKVLSLANAVNYLDIQDLLDAVLKRVADEIRGKPTEQIREILNLEDDLTPEEKAKMREEHSWLMEAQS